jgi:hypothetical protein
MPAAHALLQTVEDVENATRDLSMEELWTRPGGAASVGFHLLHLAGATDRLLTHARGATLNDAQKATLAAEKVPPHTDAASLLEASGARSMPRWPKSARRPPRPARCPNDRRAALPTTVLGLIFHAAEHASAMPDRSSRRSRCCGSPAHNDLNQRLVRQFHQRGLIQLAQPVRSMMFTRCHFQSHVTSELALDLDPAMCAMMAPWPRLLPGRLTRGLKSGTFI